MSDWNEALELAASKCDEIALREEYDEFDSGVCSGARSAAKEIRSLKRPADQDGWRPIESAPRDGTPFLVYWLRRYSDGERYEAVQPQCVCHFMGGRLFPSWIEENKDYPTHWRPLPSAPTPEAK